MAVREPVHVVPPELAVHERKHRIDRVVRLVPALRASLLEPALCLAELLARSRELLVQHQRDPVGRPLEAPPAAAAGEAAVPLLAQGAAAERATQDLEQRHGHGFPAGQPSGQRMRCAPAQTPALQPLVTLTCVLRAGAAQHRSSAWRTSTRRRRAAP